MFREVESDIDVIKAVDFTEEISSRVWIALSKVIKSCLLPEQSYGSDRPAEEADFEQFQNEIVFGLSVLHNFISKFVSSQNYQSFDRDSLASTREQMSLHHVEVVLSIISISTRKVSVAGLDPDTLRRTCFY